MRRPRATVLLAAAVALALAAAGCSSGGDDRRPPAGPRTGQGSGDAAVTDRPCGWRAAPPPTYQHVIWLFMENHSYPDVIGAPGSAAATAAPYLNRLATRCGLSARYYGVTHPSLPNYLAVVSGRTGGVRTSCLPAACPQSRRTVLHQLRAAGRSWRVYAEAMTSNCLPTNTGRYVVRHNPATYFPSLAGDCARWDVSMGRTSGGRFARVLAEDRLPALSVLVPDQCHNTHDCSIAAGDAWLARLVPQVLASPAYRVGRTALFVTYDEGAGGRAGQDCRADQDRSCHVATVVVSPSTPAGTKVYQRFDHYSLLRTTERMLGLKDLLGNAATAPGMRAPFHL